MNSSGSEKGTSRQCLACGMEVSPDMVTCPNDGTQLVAGDPLIGTIIDKYQVMELLGRGGMSTVYKARHVFIDRLVAIKLLRSDLVYDPKMLQRFQLEAKAVSKLKHPNIMAVHDFGVTQQGLPYMAMDLLDGKTMDELLEFEGQLAPPRCVQLFMMICDALGHAHEKGVIHRDIKPSNVMISLEDGKEHPKLVDFGIAKMLAAANPSVPSLTSTGEIFGSPLYMSPEQYRGKPVDARTDIYALGCVIYEVLTGWPALQGQTVMETMYKHLSEMPLSFSTLRPDLGLSTDLEAVVFKAIQKEPDDRFQSMNDFANALAASKTSTEPRAVHTTAEMQFDTSATMAVPMAPPEIPSAQAVHDSISMPQNRQSSAAAGVHPGAEIRQPVEPAPKANPADFEPEPAEVFKQPSLVAPSSLFGYDTLTPAKSDEFFAPAEVVPRLAQAQNSAAANPPNQYVPAQAQNTAAANAPNQYVPLQSAPQADLQIGSTGLQSAQRHGEVIKPAAFQINRTVIIAIIAFLICLIGTMFLINSLAHG